MNKSPSIERRFDEIRVWFEEQGFVLSVEQADSDFVALLRHVTQADPTKAFAFGSGPSPVLAALVAEQRYKAEEIGSGTVLGDTYLDKARERLRRFGLASPN